MNSAMAILLSFGYAGALLDAIWSDVRGFRIPNRVPVLLLVAFIPMAIASGFAIQDWFDHLGIALILFGASVALYAFGVLSSGAAKLIPCVGLWIAIDDFPRFLEIVVVAGGVLGLVALMTRWVPLALGSQLDPKGKMRQWGESMIAAGHIPLGLAIAAGGLDHWVQWVMPQ